MARHLCCSTDYIREVERGTVPPLSTSKIVSVAKLFGVDPDRLLRAAADEAASAEKSFQGEQEIRGL